MMRVSFLIVGDLLKHSQMVGFGEALTDQMEHPFLFRIPLISYFPFLKICKSFLVNTAVQSSSHNCPIDKSDALVRIAILIRFNADTCWSSDCWTICQQLCNFFACVSIRYVPDAPESAFITSVSCKIFSIEGGTTGLILFILSVMIIPVPPRQEHPNVLPPILFAMVASSLWPGHLFLQPGES